MCLEIDTELTAKIRDKHKYDKTIDIYKVVSVSDDKQILSPYESYYKWKVGVNRPLGDYTKQPFNDGNIYYGLHAFYGLAGAEILLNKFVNYTNIKYSYKIIKLFVNPNCLIAAGRNMDVVFSELYLSKEEYDKALEN